MKSVSNTQGWRQFSVVIAIIVLITVLCAVSPLEARIINVPEDQETIQGAVNEAQEGDTVLVQPGRYVENIRFIGQSIVVGSLFLTTRNEEFIERTIIDGNRNGGSVVTFRMGERGLFTGFTVQNGETDYGGGIYIRSSSPTLSHLIVTGNTVERNGAGVYCTQFSSPVISDVVMSNNSCGYVGSGFGAYGGSTPTLTNCVIYGNYSDHVGGGIHAHSSEITLNRVTISHNRALHTGGAIYLTQDARADLSECILWENEPHEIQLAFVNEAIILNVSHSDVDGGREEVEMFDISEVNWIVGNIDQDPQFTNPDEGDYSLTEDSPCIDSGNPESDPDPDGTISDMGAFYFHNEDGRFALHVPEAFDSIQEAIDEADNGDVVLVQPGEYTENINFAGKNITIGSRVISTGNEGFIEETVIDGDENGSVVTFENNESEDAVLIGFTITNGSAENGGGILIREASPVIYKNVIMQNRAGHDGGGIYCINNSNPLFDNCMIVGNFAEDEGGGIKLDNDTEPTITQCVIVGNETRGNGGGINCGSGDNPLIYCCTITENTGEFGGGIWCSNNSRPTILNSILWNNDPQEVFFDSNREPNSISIAYSDLTGGFDAIVVNDNGEVGWGEGNIDADPLFANADEGDYHLTEESPCLDSGNPDSPLDPDDTRADMGAFYLHHTIERDPITINVPDDFETIQTAINMAQRGDTILVRPGTYVENLDFRGISVTLASLFLTTGDPAYIDSTVIDGNGSDAVVKYNSREDSQSKLTGFTIRNGSHQEGGGIYCFNSSPIISYCAIYGNEAEAGGSAIFCYASSPSFYNCTITANTTEEGGAISLWSASYVTLRNTIIRDNSPVQIYFGGDRDPSSINIYYSDIEDGEDGIEDNGNGYINWDDGNIDVDPLFVDADEHDYRLTEDSPCIDAGDPDSPEDIDHTRADMGAFFFCINLNPIPLESGWNLMSSWVEPPNDDMWVIWSSFLERGDLILVKDHEGRFFWPQFNYNNIPGWDVHYGYQVKVFRQSRLYIVGEPLPEDEPIDLSEGWSIAAYYPEQAIPVIEALSNIENVLVFVKDGKGRFYIPEYEYSNMIPMRRGQGYQINVSEAVELVWNVPDRVAFADYDYRDHPSQVYFKSPIPTGSNMSLLILESDVSCEGKMEIGVFTVDGLCVGAGVFNGNTPCGMAVWEDDPTTDEIDGAVEGERLEMRMADQNGEHIVGYDLLESSSGSSKNAIYTTDGLTVVRLAGEKLLPVKFDLTGCYPNPFNATTIIPYQLPERSKLSIDIFDITGRQVANLVNGNVEAGYYRTLWNGIDFPSGVYVCHMKANRFTKSIKIVLIR